MLRTVHKVYEILMEDYAGRQRKKKTRVLVTKKLIILTGAKTGEEESMARIKDQD